MARRGAEREDGGPGGFLEGVGNIVGLGEADNGSDMVRGRGGRELMREERREGHLYTSLHRGFGETG